MNQNKISKVCIIAPSIPPNISGAGRRMFNQAKYLAHTGINISLITNTDDHNNESNNLNIEVIKLPEWFKGKNGNKKLVRNFKAVIYQPVLFIALYKLLKKSRFDVVHLVNSHSRLSLFAIIIAKFKGIKIINSTTLLGSDDPISIEKNKGKLMKKIYFDFPDKIINNSLALSEACKEAGLPSQKYTFIPNPVDDEKFKPIRFQKEKNQIKKEFGIDKYDFVLLTVSLFRRRKNIDELIHVFKEVNNEVKNSCFLIAGNINESYDYYKYIVGIVEEYNLSDNVKFLGEIDNVDEVMKASDVFIFASSREGMPNVVLEAMSSGLPIVIKRIPNVTDTIFNKHNGIVVNNRNQFVKSVINIASNRSLIEKIGLNARKCVEKKYSKNIIMDRYLDQYKKI